MFFRRVSVIVMSGCLMLAAHVVKAADAPLSVFPSDTSIVVKLSSPKKVIKNLADAVNLVQPGFGGMVEGQATSIGVGISNPTLQGVDMEKNWWMAVFMIEDSEPQVVFAIPATDVDDMEDAIDESFTFVKKDNWGIYSEDEDAVKRIQSVISGSGKSIEAALSGKLLSSFDSGDLSIYVNTPTLVTLYSEQLDEAVENAKGEIANMEKEDNPALASVDLGFLKENLPKLFDKGVEALKDNVGMVLTLNANTKGLQINKVLVQKPSSESAKFLSGITSANIDPLLVSLPANQPIYLASSVDFTKAAVHIYDLMGTATTDEEIKTAIANMKSALTGTTSKGFSAAVGLGSMEEGVLRTYGVQLVTPATKMKGVVKDAQKLAGLFNGGELQQEMTYEENKEKVSGKSVDIMTVTQSFENPQMSQMTEQITKIMYGPEGITTRMMYLDEGILQSTGGGTAGMEETYRAFTAKENLKSGSALARDRAALQSKLAFVELLDFVSIAAKGAVIAAESGQVPLPISPEQIESIEIQPSYVGVSLAIEDNAIEGRLNIPIEQIQNGMKFGMSIMQMMQQEAN